MNDFNYYDCSSEEDDLSSNDEWSESSESSKSYEHFDLFTKKLFFFSINVGDRLNSTSSTRQLRHTSSRAMQRQISSGSIDEPLSVNKSQRRSKKLRKKVTPSREGTSCVMTYVISEIYLLSAIK